MKKLVMGVLGVVLCFAVTSCAKQESIQVSKDEPTVYLNVSAAKASSFDDTPDWAPMPDPMAPFDHDMLTRWSPKLGLDNEWIYLDFGKEKVMNKLVIKWERAYAPEYEILTSNDAKTWTRLMLKKDGKGNAETLEFPPVKTRYVKLIGLKRANPEWGFSIWEMEPYGPKSLNTDEKVVEVAKEKNKVEEDTFKKELEAAKGTLTPLDPNAFQKGICYTSWMFDELSGQASDKMLIHLKNQGADFIAIVIPAYQNETNSTMIFTNDVEGGDTPSDASIEHAIQTAHYLGMKVMLKPHVDPRTNQARVDIVASDPWFDSYEKMIIKYAKMAEKNKVEMFAVGTELEGTTFSRWETKWRDIITKVKAVYHGPLTYAANWTEYKGVPFWDMIDYIGIDAYFPLTNKNDPTMDELVAAWTKVADELQAWLSEKNITKSVIFTEIGYPSSDGANKQPWSQITDVEDQDEQRDALDALFTVMAKRSFFKGTYLWQYLPQDRWSPLGFTVKGKKAEKVLSKWYKELK